VTKTFLRFAAIAILGLFLVSCSTSDANPTEDLGEVDDSAQVAEVQEAPTPDSQSEQEPAPAQEELVVDINPFEDGLGGGNTDEFPFPATDDAFDFEKVLSLYSYTTYYDMDELIMLYLAALPTLGYSLNSDTVIPEMAVLSYEADGQALTLNISTNEDGSNTVSILVGELQ
jgi:hypothetical protein